jgi:sporulation protein YlmC with PRC-barrel domain
VPLAAVGNATAEVVDLVIDEAAFRECEPFDEPAFNEPGEDFTPIGLGYEPGAYFLEPFASPLDGFALADHERIPKGEVTIRRGDEVVAADGQSVGHVDELLVDPADGHVTHVVLREGNFLRREDVVVPIAGARFDEGRVVLGLDTAQLGELDHIPVKRHGHVTSRQGAPPA